eukprot:10899227-Alexandrium_andersonii.AAC.1
MLTSPHRGASARLTSLPQSSIGPSNVGWWLSAPEGRRGGPSKGTAPLLLTGSLPAVARPAG